MCGKVIKRVMIDRMDATIVDQVKRLRVLQAGSQIKLRNFFRIWVSSIPGILLRIIRDTQI